MIVRKLIFPHLKSSFQSFLSPFSILTERVQEDDPGDSGTSFSMDESGAEPKLPASEWFPLRPNAVGEDDEDSSHVTNVGAVTAVHGSNSGDRLQNIPHAWSDDDNKHSPPERSQPDGRDGPDLKRTPWMASNQPAVVPSSQSSDIDNGTAASKDSASDVSVLSQPQSDHNITPLDIIARSVPPTKKGVSLMSELRQRRAPQLNSDSDTESPVSKLLGPNFRAVQQVLDRLKQEKLTGSVSDEAEEVASERQSLTEESLRSTSSAGLPASTSMSRVHEAQWTSQAKPRSSIERLNRHDAPFSRAFSTHNEERLGQRSSLDEIHRRFSDSNISLGNATEGSETRRVSNWSSARVPYDSSEMSPVDAVPKSNLEPAAKKSSHDLLRFSSEASGDTNIRMPTSTQPTAKKSSLELMRFSAAATSATNVRMPSSTQLAVKESTQDLMRFSSAASSATNDRMPASAQLTIKESTHDLMRFSSAASSATNVRMPASTELAVKKPSHDPARFSSATSSAANGGILEDEYPAASIDKREVFPHHNLIDDGPVDALPAPLLPTTNRYSPEQNSRSSIETSLKTSRIAWGEHVTLPSTTTEMAGRKSHEVVHSGTHALLERLHDLTPPSTVGSSIPMESRIPTSSSRELSGHSPKHADSVLVSGKTSVNLSDRTGASSHYPNGTERDERQTLQSVGGVQHVRDSDATTSSDDTDDLLSYEPVLEGDRQYLRTRMQRQSKYSEHRQKRSEEMENGDSRIVAGRSREIDTAPRLPGKDDSSSIPQRQSQDGDLGTPVQLDDSHIKSLHWSLGAGTISPISVTSLGQLSSQKEKSSTPLGPITERSSVLENGTLQEQSIEEDDASAHTNDRNLTASKHTGSHSTTDFSSSDEMYRPVLYRDGLENQENHTSSYGIYDIRRSSGPGSTNRRRKALGLEPNPARENASQNRGGMVYISGDSTPNSVRDGSRQPSREDVDLAGSAAVYRETTQPGLEYYEGRMERDEGLRRPRTKDYGMVRESNVRKGKQAREVLRKSDFHHDDDDYLSREERRSDRSHGHQSRPSASQDASVRNRTTERTPEQALDIRERSRRLAGQYMESTDSKGTDHSAGGRSGSSRKSRSKYPADSLVSSSLQTRSEQASRSRKHHDSKSRHRSRDGKDSHARLDANISKLSSLISKSTDESISSSSQMSVIPTSRWPSKRSKRHKTSSSSGSSDVSEYFNYAFMEPHLRSSIKHKIRLRELLKSVKARDISPIVRVRENTSTESASFVSSDGTAGREREEETPERERGAPSEVTHPPRPQAFDIPISTSRPTGSEPQIPCTCSQRPVAQTAASYGLRAREEIYNGMEFGMPKKRDVGVNIPTPVVSRSQSPSSDYSRQHEDASTQTEEVDIRRRGKRLVDSEPMKSQRKSAKSPLRDAEEFGVISQPSPSKSDFIYRVDQRESKHKPKERLVASQNSPGHGAKKSSDRTLRAPLPTWFLPLTSKMQTEKRTETNFKTPSRSRTSDESRVDVFDSAVNPSPSLQKLSLQEAFLYARPQFVKRSQERVARIEEAAREKDRRKMIAETAAEENRIAEAQRAKRLEYVVSPKFKPRVKGAGE